MPAGVVSLISNVRFYGVGILYILSVLIVLRKQYDNC